MELVQAVGEVNVNSGDGMIMTKNVDMSETFEKIETSLDSRERKKSKYLSYPYINLGPGHKGLPAKTEDSQIPCLYHQVEGSSVANNHFNGSPTTAKSGSKRFRRNWHRKFINWNAMSSSPEFINASSAELLSGLYSKAVGYMFPIENERFDLVEWFFCRYRLSKYHDEAELAASLINVKGGNSGISLRNDSLDINTEQKTRNKKKLEHALRHKAKSLSGLSDMNRGIAASEFLLNGSMGMNTRRPWGNMEEITPLHQLQNVGTATLNGSRGKCSSVPEGLQFLSCLASEGTGCKKRKTTLAAPEHPSSQNISGLLDVNGKSTKCSSLVIDLQMASPPTNGVPEKCNGENKEEFVLIGSNPELYASQLDLVENIANHSMLVNTTSDFDVASANIPLQRRQKGKEKAPIEHLKTKVAAAMPDLNDTSTEYNSIRKEHEDVNGLSPELKSKHSKESNQELNSDHSRNLSDGMGLTQTSNLNTMEGNGKALENCLLLQFDSGVSLPSKEDLLATFFRFGPLKVSETKLLQHGGYAQIVFVKSADAEEAFGSIEQNKPFSATLVDCKLHHFSETVQPVEPAQPSGSKPPLGEAPPLDFIRQNLQMMTSVLEKSGDNLSPQMRDKLESEIKNLLKKVNSMAGSFSKKV